MGVHVCGLHADAHNATEQADHPVRPSLIGFRFVEANHPLLLNLLDLVINEPKARHVAAKFRHRQRRNRAPFRGAKTIELFESFALRGIDVTDPETGERRLHPVDDACPFANEIFAFSRRPSRVFVLDRRRRCHAAMPSLAAKPPEQHSQEQSCIEPIRLGSAAIPGHSHATGMNDVRLDAVGSEPTRQPKSIATSLVGDDKARDLSAGRLAFLTRPIDERQEEIGIRFKLLQRLAFELRGAFL